ncbi:hypothetical protein ABZV31_04690 [Streptomyces sp. NPDC005202]|uniref:hypothetical protein n=1 Tax=Streptomyces sp. NPDC005202 TaxID=3157021 RepID=UPI00339ED11D
MRSWALTCEHWSAELAQAIVDTTHYNRPPLVENAATGDAALAEVPRQKSVDGRQEDLAGAHQPVRLP